MDSRSHHRRRWWAEQGRLKRRLYRRNLLLRRVRMKRSEGVCALNLISHDIEWIAMWHYKVNGRGPENVAESLFNTLR